MKMNDAVEACEYLQFFQLTEGCLETMDRQLFEELFKMDVEEVKALHKELWDKWTWDDSSKEVKSKIDDIDTYLKARQSMGLDASSS